MTVVTPGGTSAISASDDFTYVAAPTVTGVSPSIGPVTAGTAVAIFGTNLSGATAVYFGGNLATNVQVVGPTEVTATSPAGTGLVNVTVVTPGGTVGHLGER